MAGAAALQANRIGSDGMLDGLEMLAVVFADAAT